MNGGIPAPQNQQPIQTPSPLSQNEIPEDKKGLGLFKIFLIIIVFVLLLGASVDALINKETFKLCPKITKVIQTVIMNKDSFEPEALTIKKCTKVIFKNQDKVLRWPASNLHPTHGIYPEFDPKQPVEAGKDWSFVFDRVGSWRYHDHLAPSTRGTVVVE